MCGLVGVVGGIYNQEKKAFRNLLEIDAARGPHSTGIAVVKQNSDDIDLIKATGRTWHLYQNHPDKFDDDDILKTFSIKALIGHNRFATTGARTAENAHPFHHGDVVGAHNGTLEKRYLPLLDGHDKFEVDSEAIFYGFNKNGWEKTLANTKGAWALTWYDKRDHKMHWIRNNERPLHWVYNAAGDALFWASEGWMLEVALGTAGIKMQKIQEFDPFEHHYIDLKGDGRIVNKKLMYEEKQHKGYEGLPPNIHVVNNDNKGGNVGNGNPFQGKDRTKVTGQNTGQRNTTNFSGTQPTNRVPNFNRKTSDMDDLVDNLTRRKVNQYICFQVYGERTDKDTLIHLLCDSRHIHEMYEIRIYAEGNPRYDEWLNSKGWYTGRVKSSVVNFDQKKGKWVRYVTLDMRTISPELDRPATPNDIAILNNPPTVKPEVIVIGSKKEEKKQEEPMGNVTYLDAKALKWDPNDNYTGYQGQQLTFSQFMQSIKNGCAECGQEPTVHEKDNLVWVGPKQFICQICDHRHRTESALKKHNIK